MKYFDDIVDKIKTASSFKEGNDLYIELRERIAFEAYQVVMATPRCRENHNDEMLDEIKEMILEAQIVHDKIHYAMDNEIFEKERKKDNV